MKPAQKNILIFIIAAAVIFLGAMLFIQKRPAAHDHSAQSKDVYYCPMHPTYVSDRPGDCPICYMKLVKKEPSVEQERAVSSTGSAAQEAKPAKDICLLHNCHKLHNGEPCPMMVVGKEGERISCPVCGNYIVEGGNLKKEKKILFWTDPMIPGYKADGPGKSPMGMDLVPVYEEDAAASAGPLPDGYAEILVTPQKQQLIGITTAPVKKQLLVKTIRAVGTVAHDPELYQAQAEYIEAVKASQRSQESAIPEVVDQSRRLVESTRIRLKHLGLSDELIEEMAALGAPQHSLLYSHPGEPVWVYAKVYEYELPFVKDGQAVTVEVPGLGGEKFEGTVRAIDPMVDPATRTIRVRVLLNDSQGNLRPEMYVNVTISIDLGEVLTVPAEAVFNTGTKQIVFVDQGQGLFEPREVTLGAGAGDVYQVTEGLTEGEVVVTSGNFLIDSESRLKASLESMTSGGGHQHGQ